AAASDPGNAAAIRELISAEDALGGALGKFNVVMEAYPDLKANQNMMQLSEELAATENTISSARQEFNHAATAYNTRREIFPSNMIAGMFNFTPATLFEVAEPEQKEAPKVRFS
ncbi:MAG: LemA family protein, partial [Pontiella sp.]|nr:LemA family protein [Pontiella sp.]